MLRWHGNRTCGCVRTILLHRLSVCSCGNGANDNDVMSDLLLVTTLSLSEGDCGSGSCNIPDPSSLRCGILMSSLLSRFKYFNLLKQE